MSIEVNDVFAAIQEYADGNNYIDVEDKLPIFICSIGAHLFNTVNRCASCPYRPDEEDDGAYAIYDCPMRHDNHPIYTPMSHVADTRLHILMRGAKGSGKNVLIDLFLREGTGLLWSAQAVLNGPNQQHRQVGFPVDMGPNSITEAGMFGSVDEEGNITGRPLARDMCGGFLGFEEFSSVTDASKKDHSMDMKNQLLTSTDSGRVNKRMRSGIVRYETRYTIWAGTQPGRFELESGLDRRFFIIDIGMSPEKERQYKEAQVRSSNMDIGTRVRLVEKNMAVREWFAKRMVDAIANPPSRLVFDATLEEWLMQGDVRSHEADLFRRLAIGYHMMQPEWKGGQSLVIKVDDRLRDLLNTSLRMRREVMDADVQLIKNTFWNSELTRSTLLKEVSRMITMGDYQGAKRWVEDNLKGQRWYSEYRPESEGRGRKGIMVKIGPPAPVAHKEVTWGNNQ
jgi:hypothetical protein